MAGLLDPVVALAEEIDVFDVVVELDMECSSGKADIGGFRALDAKLLPAQDAGGGGSVGGWPLRFAVFTAFKQSNLSCTTSL